MTHRGYSLLSRTTIAAAVVVACFTFGARSWSQEAGDKDRDAIPDLIDNCTAVSNPDQRDTDGDGIGNICDGDFDNNGIVDSKDYAILRGRLGTKDPNADLDGNGMVDSTDAGLFRPLMQLPPGPSAVAVSFNTPALNFAENPPPAVRSELFGMGSASLPKSAAAGRDGVMLMEFSPTVRKQFSIRSTMIVRPSGSGDVLNDLGISPDLKAGDNIFTGFVKLPESPAEAQRDIDLFRNRLPSFPNPQAGIFRGRTLAGMARTFPLDIRLPSPPLPGLVPFPDIVLPHFPPLLCATGRCLAITDLSVVADPGRTFDMCDVDGDGNQGNVNGPWSFKTLMTNMANTAVTGVTPQEFAHAWLRRWLVNGNVNGFVVPNRAAGIQSQILNSLPGWNPANPATLDMNALPFRLLAILYRPDLASSGIYGGSSTNPSEIRFVFGLLRRNGASCGPNQSGMTVILEYADRSSCLGLKSRAQQFIDLDFLNPPFPSPAYNAALQAITDDVTTANAVPTRPNGSSLNQLRTNEIAFGPIWEFREFRIDAATHQLEPHTLAQTPDVSHNMTARLAACMNNAACRQTVPAAFMGANFLAGSQAYAPTFAFDAAGVAVNQNRRDFSGNTCGGCHAANMLNPAVNMGAGGLNVVPPFPFSLSGAPESFYHVDPRTPGGTPARLSRFMTGTAPTAPGTPIPDRVLPGGSAAMGAVHFNDLLLRGGVMQTQATASCVVIPHLPFAIEQIQLPNVH